MVNRPMVSKQAETCVKNRVGLHLCMKAGVV